MGRIHKRFTVRNEHGQASAVGKVDTGADVTLVRLDIGRRLGADTLTSKGVTIGGIGGQRVVGLEVPATVKIGASEAQLALAVPVGVVDNHGNFTPRAQKINLIGHDFLQATGAALDFSRSGAQAFVEGARVDYAELLSMSAEEERAFRKWVIKQYPDLRRRASRKKRRHIYKPR